MRPVPLQRSAPAPRQLLSVTTVPDPRPGRVVVEVAGELDNCTAPALDLCLRSQAGQPGLRELVVFLGRVTFLGTAGVQVLADADRRCRLRGARLIIRTGGRRAVLRALRLTRFTDVAAVDPVDGERPLPTGVPRSVPARTARTWAGAGTHRRS